MTTGQTPQLALAAVYDEGGDAYSDGYGNGPALRAENAGLLAGGWVAYPGTRIGHELIGAGSLIIAGPIDGDELISRLAEGQARVRTSWTASDF